ncbi:ABC transporter domain-containing protein [Aureobasidium subglaciale]|nr:ABC transporter domain-containing protein [Aureobasidium subglaciale]KAI5215041.1 ABC transporter domain-containing protein [Aureobasidium subglaciale]KAI5218164.1 ABC transporter domain-containing protein [Aureobasidium subglaciale]KAI5255882.1 ABC transporter domain-containing protein [Aureobasidium subglaciale]
MVASKKGALSVTAQQSRFYAQKQESVSTEYLGQETYIQSQIAVKDLSVTIGNHEILSHAQLQLHPGRHYVLVGRNGVGKSTLLRAMAEGLIPGISGTIRVLLLGQVQEDGDDESTTPSSSSETVLEHVLRSDRLRERRLHEASRLSTAMDNVDDPMAMLRVYRELTCERLQRDVAEARHKASKTSGVRGLGARKTLTALEEKLADALLRLDQLKHSSQSELEDSTTVKEETQKAMDMLTDVQASLSSMDAASAEAKARSILLGIGFSTQRIENPVSQLSGGWKTRCSLACALCQSTDILLLDEPTNFLDLPSIIWLEKYIQTLDTSVTLITVTHDRAFADGVADELLVLRNQSIETFKGNVSGYETARLKSYKYLSKMQAAQDKQKKHIQATIDQNLKTAKRSGDDKKLKQMSSRQKKLNERMGMEVSAKGTRFKLNRDRAGWHDSLRDAIEVPDFDPPPRMSFPIHPSDLRFPGALISLENVCFDYKSGAKTQTPILRDVNLTIHLGDRVGLVGLNGSGKSTLVSLMTAKSTDNTSSHVPNKGSVAKHTRARIGLYSQQAVEELQDLTSDRPGLTALTHLMEFANQIVSEQEARGLLSSVGLVGKVTSEVPISLLSGGQKVRLALAKVLWNPPHLLILDEVTTHLDPDTIQALALRLRNYQGAILLITHDRFFMRCVIEGESPRKSSGGTEGESDEDTDSSEDGLPNCGVVYRLSKTRLRKLEGGMQQYEDMMAKLSS